MANFNLADYETVKSRKERFYNDYPDGRITVDLINAESVMDHAVFRARVFTTQEDQFKDCPRGVGYALEVRDKELSISSKGSKYETVNYSSWTENCEESAVGRALDNAGYSGNKKPSQEEMKKVGQMNRVMTDYNTPKTASTSEYGQCPKCGKELVMKDNGAKKFIKCSAGGWDRIAKKATGCDFVDWMNGENDYLNSDIDRGDSVTKDEQPDF